MKRKHDKGIPHRTFYMPPQDGIVPDPLREALYGTKPLPAKPEAVPPPPLEGMPKLGTVAARRHAAAIANTEADLKPSPGIARDDFSSCYLPEPWSGHVKTSSIVATFARFGDWRLSRLVLQNGEVMWRLANGQPLQTGIFTYKNGVLNFAPTNQEAIIPSAVSAAAEQYIKSNTPPAK